MMMATSMLILALVAPAPAPAPAQTVTQTLPACRDKQLLTQLYAMAALPPSDEAKQAFDRMLFQAITGGGEAPLCFVPNVGDKVSVRGAPITLKVGGKDKQFVLMSSRDFPVPRGTAYWFPISGLR